MERLFGTVTSDDGAEFSLVVHLPSPVNGGGWHRGLPCPACGDERYYDSPKHHALAECAACGCVHGQLYLGDSFGVVKPSMTCNPASDARAVPYDLTCLGSGGITRRHGFFDPLTGLITQVG